MAETGMVERCAAAIYLARNGHGAVPWSRRDASHKAPYLIDARAAIEAMREPTEEMISADALQLELVLAVKAAWAACDMIVEGPTSVASVACTAVLDHLKARAVIDAALKEGD